MNSIFILICPSLDITEVTTGDGEYRAGGVWAQSGALFSLEEGNIGRYSQAESTEDGPKGRIKRYPISLFA